MKIRLRIVLYGSMLLGIVLFLCSCSTPYQKPASKTYTVEIKQMQFQPSELAVQSGDTVVFINKDMVVHDVTELANKTWTSAPLSPGQSYSMVVVKSSDYYCSIHPVMKGKLLVK